jgi:hypothetical protein
MRPDSRFVPLVIAVLLAFGMSLGNPSEGAGTDPRFEASQGQNSLRSLAKLDPDDGQSGDWFGFSLALEEDLLIVGAPHAKNESGEDAGAVYVFQRGSDWQDGSGNQIAKLTAGDGDSGDWFGYAVDIEGETIVVSAKAEEDPNGFESGAVYVFEKGEGWADGSGNQVAKLLPGDGDADDGFGYAVSIAGDALAVGAERDEDPNGDLSGSVYLFEKGGGWADGSGNQVAKLDPEDGDAEDRFGFALDLEAETLVVGAYYDEDPNGYKSGSAYVFEKGDGWADGHANQVAKLDPAGADNRGFFGRAVAISGETLLVGAFKEEVPHGTAAGAAYIFRVGSGWTDGHANQIAKLDPDDGDTFDFFGRAVALDGDFALIGAELDEDPNGEQAGSAYWFQRGVEWQDGSGNQITRLAADDGDGGDAYGVSVAVFESTSAIGAYLDENPNGLEAGAVYLYQREVPAPHIPADFDGEGDTDISVYRPGNGNWYIFGEAPVSWGLAGDLPVPGDYDGDGAKDIAVYRPGNGNWYIKDQGVISWGIDGDVPLPCDYDGDGQDDVAVYRPGNGNWYIQGLVSIPWGRSEDIPVPADYDGDGACEQAVYRPSNGNWYVNGQSPQSWGRNEDMPVPGDYDGDGETDIAVYRPSNGRWYIMGQCSLSWGRTGDLPVPGDYNGDGAWEAAVLRESNGKWYIQDVGTYTWYAAGDYPLPVRDTDADGRPYDLNE